MEVRRLESLESLSGHEMGIGIGIGMNNKCAWCDRQRERNDLCNRCRQKVESRARAINEQKMLGDCQVIQKIASFYYANVDFSKVSNITQFCQTFVETFPFLVCNYVCPTYCATHMHLSDH